MEVLRGVGGVQPGGRHVGHRGAAQRGVYPRLRRVMHLMMGGEFGRSRKIELGSAVTIPQK